MRKYLFICLVAMLATYGCQQSGPQTTKLGNQYILHTSSKEGPAAETGSYAYIHAAIRKGDSIVFNTRDNGDATAIQIPSDTMGVGEVGPVEDVLRGLHKGDSVTVIFRIDTLEQKPPGFEDANEIFYDIVITDVITEAEFLSRKEVEQAELQKKMDATMARGPEVSEMAAQFQKAYKAGEVENIQSTPSGLRYVIHEAGTGPQAEAGKIVSVQYYGSLSEDGFVFDQSFVRGRPIEFPLGQNRVIAGWEEGLALLKAGAKATFIIPAELGYGAAGTPDGSIPPDSELLFYVELEEVK